MPHLQRSLLSNAPRKFLMGNSLPNVDRIVLVAAGKGGVGKSTVSVNVAASAAKSGARVGLLDADVFGPSLATMMGLEGRPMRLAEEKEKTEKDGKWTRLDPLESHGVHCASMSLLMPPGRAPVWRGPLVMSAVRRLLHGVRWPRLDLLVVDMPPGTGDVPLSVTQMAKVDGCLLVSTGQRVCVGDLARTWEMLQLLAVPALGCVHNLCKYKCPDCGSVHSLMPSAALETFCSDSRLPVLAELAWDSDELRCLDNGVPSAIGCPDSDNSKQYRRLAESLLKL